MNHFHALLYIYAWNPDGVRHSGIPFNLGYEWLLAPLSVIDNGNTEPLMQRMFRPLFVSIVAVGARTLCLVDGSMKLSWTGGGRRSRFRRVLGPERLSVESPELSV